MAHDIIVAVNHTNTIGHQGTIPWSCAEDMRYFRQKTLEKPIIMGRKTFDSIGKALDKRINIVVSRNTTWHAEHTHLASNFSKALSLCHTLCPEQTPLVIGGAMLYQEAITHPNMRHLYITVINDHTVGDVFFPYSIDELMREGWSQLEKTKGQDCLFYTLIAPSFNRPHPLT